VSAFFCLDLLPWQEVFLLRGDFHRDPEDRFIVSTGYSRFGPLSSCSS